MSITRTISADNLAALVEDLVRAGVTVVAPSRADDGVDYRTIVSLDEADLGGDMPRRSLRGVFQPPTERLFMWRREGGRISLKATPPQAPPTVVLGARPCDAAGAEALDQVMGWDYRDEFWFARREATTMISLACPTVFPSCFCEAVGLGPASPVGADILLHPREGGYGVEVVSPRGEAFVSEHAGRFAEAAEETAAPPAGREPLPLKKVQGWLESHFDDAFWEGIALRCLGCGACTSVCPTCHCFDIVDEPRGISAGERRRNWDTCQAGLFTVHASGHNPRPDQTARCRQRVMHKFYIYPTRFGEVLCTGCGRCVEACPAGVNIPEILEDIVRRAAEVPAVGEPA